MPAPRTLYLPDGRRIEAQALWCRSIEIKLIGTRGSVTAKLTISTRRAKALAEMLLRTLDDIDATGGLP